MKESKLQALLDEGSYAWRSYIDHIIESSNLDKQAADTSAEAMIQQVVVDDLLRLVRSHTGEHQLARTST